MHALVESNHQLSQQLVTLKQSYAEIESSLQSSKLQNASLESERDSLAAAVQILTDDKDQFQLEQARLSELQASQQNDLELCSRERAELQADRAALQTKLDEQETVAEKMRTAIQNLFPHEHYRTLHPDLSQASPEDLTRHFRDVGQYLDTPPYSQLLLDGISALAQQRDHYASLLAERDSLAAAVQILTDDKDQFQLEQARLSELQASQQNDLELCSRERAELQADRAALQTKLDEQETVAEKMRTAIQNLFPHEHYRTLHPDLSQASPEDLTRHFLDVGQYLDTPPYSQLLLDGISALAQQRDQSMAKLSVLEANFEHMATEIATFKDLFARLISKAAAPALASAP